MVNKIPTIFLKDEVLELGTVTENVTAKTILEKNPDQTRKIREDFLGNPNLRLWLRNRGFPAQTKKATGAGLRKVDSGLKMLIEPI